VERRRDASRSAVGRGARGWSGPTSAPTSIDRRRQPERPKSGGPVADRDRPQADAAIRYEGTVDDEFKFAIWISDDVARVPLVLRAESKWGDLTAELVEYEAAE
jgi:hypothetical protein